MKKTIKLSFHESLIPYWLVEEVTNSITYNPGEILEKSEVDRICNSSTWIVKIVKGVKR